MTQGSIDGCWEFPQFSLPYLAAADAYDASRAGVGADPRCANV